jgi:hypothetical protein
MNHLTQSHLYLLESLDSKRNVDPALLKKSLNLKSSRNQNLENQNKKSLLERRSVKLRAQNHPMNQLVNHRERRRITTMARAGLLMKDRREPVLTRKMQTTSAQTRITLKLPIPRNQCLSKKTTCLRRVKRNMPFSLRRRTSHQSSLILKTMRLLKRASEVVRNLN